MSLYERSYRDTRVAIKAARRAKRAVMAHAFTLASLMADDGHDGEFYSLGDMLPHDTIEDAEALVERASQWYGMWPYYQLKAPAIALSIALDKLRECAEFVETMKAGSGCNDGAAYASFAQTAARQAKKGSYYA